MPHPYKDILEVEEDDNLASGSAFDSYDSEAGNFKRKRSLVRRDRSRPQSYQASLAGNGSKYSKNNTSVRFSYQTNPASQNNGLGYLDGEDHSGDIQLQNLQADFAEDRHRSYNDNDANPFITESERFPATKNSYPLDTQPKEIMHLNDEPLHTENHISRFNDESENAPLTNTEYSAMPPKRLDLEEEHNGFPYWKLYCYAITFWAPPPLLNLFGLKTKDRQYAWREKMGLIGLVLCCGAIIAFLTFGFTRTTCTHVATRLNPDDISDGYLIINGRAYDLANSLHPAADGIPADSNVLYPPINAGGKDASLLFQNVNGNCKGLIKPKDNCAIPHDEDELAWYMPCKILELDGSTKPNFTWDYYEGYACHTATAARTQFYSLKVQGDVYYSWESLTNSSRNLIVYNGHVIDMDYMNWFFTDDFTYPELFDDLKNDASMKGYDISLLLTEPHERQAADCLVEIAKIGIVDTSTVGCIASTVVLYTALVFVLSVTLSQFFVAIYFRWCIAPYQGVPYSSLKEMNEKNNEIENWANDPYHPAPLADVPRKRRADYHDSNNMKSRKGLRLSWGGDINEFIGETNKTKNITNYEPKYITMTTEAYMMANAGKRKSRSMSHVSLVDNPFDDEEIETLDTSLISPDAVPQPPVNWEPFGYPLVHTMCLVTCYSEDADGIRTTLDSVATTDYPNSHKLMVIICDGIITGSGNEKSTPEICLDMITDVVTPVDEVQPFSYVSVAQGSKRHNMAKVYAGFYKYDDSTVPPEKQQKIPVLLIVKCGTPQELTSAKPGNRGKRDSQIILMSFLQAVTFNDRMTPLQFEMMKSIWQVTGLMPAMYETVLMVDADTLVYPDSLTHMTAEFVRDPEIMGLCGETKISNKAQSWVTAIQVFEYYISHHQQKAFESTFGSVTCLPGCFCMYRIKSPKSTNVWVPILANSDIVEKYSDNVLDSLHKKNLLLLGEDRYLTSLMLRAFPRRRQIFVPKAACKTIVPDKFKVLLSQRRRWINSTVHNLMELALVQDLCGAFCLSMQFVIIIQLVGTLVLPVSITFTLYIIIVAIISTPTPIMSLCLMGVIFGAPAILIVVTVSNITYVLWMIIYLFSLPVWNFVLPTYAYWKFDDFSWGDTRKLEGGDKAAHGNGEGEFDGSQIKHMTWREFEQRRKMQTSQKNENHESMSNFASVYNPGNFRFEEEPNYIDMSHRADDTNY